MFGLFKKKPAPPADRRVWNEDWQIGDTAECIRDDWYNPPVPPWEQPRVGQHFIIAGFRESIGTRGSLAYYLVFEGLPKEWGWETSCFRKVRPEAKEESEIVERILKAKPGKDQPRLPHEEEA